MRRWAVEKSYVTADQETLQSIVVHPECDNKIKVKAENREYAYRRLLLVGEKGNKGARYSIAKVSKIG